MYKMYSIDFLILDSFRVLMFYYQSSTWQHTVSHLKDGAWHLLNAIWP